MVPSPVICYISDAVTIPFVLPLYKYNVIRYFNNPFSFDGWMARDYGRWWWWKLREESWCKNHSFQVWQVCKITKSCCCFHWKEICVLHNRTTSHTNLFFLFICEQSEQSEKADDENKLPAEDENIPDKATHYLRK